MKKFVVLGRISAYARQCADLVQDFVAVMSAADWRRLSEYSSIKIKPLRERS